MLAQYHIEDEGLITAYKEADKYTWKKEYLIAYDNASMREQDERGSRELAKEEGKEEKEIELILKIYSKKKTAEKIANLLDIPLAKVRETIQKHGIEK